MNRKLIEITIIKKKLFKELNIVYIFLWSMRSSWTRDWSTRPDVGSKRPEVNGNLAALTRDDPAKLF